MTKDIKITRLLRETRASTRRFCIHVGGSRSGKTTAVLQYLIFLANEARRDILVVRKTRTALSASGLSDFKRIMSELGLWDTQAFNITTAVYSWPNGSTITFTGADDPQKLRGRRQDVAFLTEANDLTFDDFTEINIRTTEKVYLDYNPSMAKSWIYDLEDGRPDECDVIHSTYLDNPHLPPEQVREIEAMRVSNPNKWRTHGLGLRGKSVAQIYSDYEVVEAFPPGIQPTYGMDFGWNDPSTLVRVAVQGDELFVQEVLYETNRTAGDLAKMIQRIVRPGERVYCDHSPAVIEELRRHGVHAENTKLKGKDSIVAGISQVLSYRIRAVRGSHNLLAELDSYRWGSDADGALTEHPMDEGLDHCLDAMRYAVTSLRKKGDPSQWRVSVR